MICVPFSSTIPRLFITSIVGQLKQESTYHSWQSMHRSFLFKHFWREHTFWSDGYFVCSMGEASPYTIRQYLLTQGFRLLPTG
ncbi:transposase [Algoriphagus sp. PAP.12]|uniref:transposase n=1 Tax=Algoriphagus sp. PAP.12 TaxID=2996678 RepID=UPI003FA3649D